MEIDIPISAVDCHYDEKENKLLLFIGDEKGQVKVQDISVIIQHYNLKPKKMTQAEINKRNPHRQQPVDKYNIYGNADDDA